jgi:hypothetical protein
MNVGAVEEEEECRDYTSGISNLLRDLNALYRDVKSADVTLIATSCRPHAQAFGHSSILAARCPGLVPQIREFLERNPHNVAREAPAILELELDNVVPMSLRPIIRYVYVGRIRLRSATVLPVMHAAQALGMEGLVHITSQHLQRKLGPRNVLPLLSLSIHLDLSSSVTTLVRFVAENASVVIRSAEFYLLAEEVVLLVVKQEDLNVSEAELWRAILGWATTYIGGTRHQTVASMTTDELDRVRPRLEKFFRPGYLRILNMDVETFASEIEPLRILECSEVLLKYRYEAAAKLATFDLAFPPGRVEFLSRIRLQSTSFQSSHPHQKGITQKFKVRLPGWAKAAHLVFDERCKLGRYADLTFYANDACSEAIGNINDIFARHRVAARAHHRGNEPRVSFPLRSFWFVMYAPHAFETGWGYSFRVTPSIV